MFISHAREASFACSKLKEFRWVDVRLFFILLLTGSALEATNWQEQVGHGNLLDQAIVGSTILVLDETVLREVARIGNRVVAASDHPELEYRFRVINTPVVNAFATCGGFVYVTSGLLDILEAPDELAAAIAHEVAHIDQLHLVERIRSTRIKKVLFISAGIALALLASDWAIEEQGPPTPYTTQRSPSDIVSTFGQGGFEMGVGLATVSIRGYNKRRELAADRAAVGYLQRSGFDPYALLRLFQRLESAPVNSSLAVSSSALVNAEPGLSQRKQALSSLLKAGVTGGTAVPPEPEGKRR